LFRQNPGSKNGISIPGKELDEGFHPLIIARIARIAKIAGIEEQPVMTDIGGACSNYGNHGNSGNFGNQRVPVNVALIAPGESS
jgi:hypothetical protein